MEHYEYRQLKPTFGGSFSFGWDVMKRYFLYLLLVIFVCSVVDAPMKFTENAEDLSALAIFLGIFALAYAVLFRPIIHYGADLMFIQAVRGEKLEFETLISGFKNYLNIVLSSLLVFALVGMALVALIIPGIIVACRLAFVPYLVMDKKLDPIEAVEQSWKLTRGHGWTIFFMGFVSIFIIIGGLILFIVGIFPALIWISAAFATLYQSVLNEKDVIPAKAE